ncbi:UDP-2,3-diacylglucosamine diphosphatase [uncultured Winogradskyella sp.]|uniref:UDP-2,3-diacylglucosamine diphosphatase n=1 Tax=uncultured Winogradskyella sp. TaxID=395353 RepID=UPI00260A4D0C|nr:UDP-2,3-diacylglucosamine diphosphatase [uncultured Winogradskyella sp.]
MKIKRKVEIAIISNTRLGSLNGEDERLLAYLNSIEPKLLILTGDIFDANPCEKPNLSEHHLKIIKKIMDFATKGTEVKCITSNTIKALSAFVKSKHVNLIITNQTLLNVDGKRVWIFNGDNFGALIQILIWFAKRCPFLYRITLRFNQFAAYSLEKLRKNRCATFLNIKGIKNVEQFPLDTEKVVVDLAIKNNCDYVLCGHLGRPKIEIKENKYGKVTYLNSGAWTEHFTALEYQFKRWKIYNYKENKLSTLISNEVIKEINENDFIAALTLVK